MRDWLIPLATDTRARRVLKALNIPFSLPRTLYRGIGPWVAEPLRGRSVVLLSLIHISEPTRPY